MCRSQARCESGLREKALVVYLPLLIEHILILLTLSLLLLIVPLDLLPLLPLLPFPLPLLPLLFLKPFLLLAVLLGALLRLPVQNLGPRLGGNRFIVRRELRAMNDMFDRLLDKRRVTWFEGLSITDRIRGRFDRPARFSQIP